MLLLSVIILETIRILPVHQTLHTYTETELVLIVLVLISGITERAYAISVLKDLLLIKGILVVFAIAILHTSQLTSLVLHVTQAS